MWDFCTRRSACNLSWSPLLREILVAVTLHRNLVAFPTWDLFPLLRRSATWTYASAMRNLVAGLVASFVYDQVLVASTTWDHLCRFSWSPPLHGTFIALVGCLHSLLLQLVAFTLVASVGRLRFTWGLFSLLRCLCYVHLFQTGLAQGHVPALLPDRSSSRVCNYTDSIVAMRWRANDSIFLKFRSPTCPVAKELGLSVRKPISSILSMVVLWKHYHCRRW